jgi:hypothetical protein
MEAVATERIAQRISSFASGHHIVNKHKIEVRRRFQRREHCRIFRKADRFAYLANTSLFGRLCCGQRRRPSIDHGTAEFRRKFLRENERNKIRPAGGRCDKKNVFAAAEVLKVARFQVAVDEVKNRRYRIALRAQSLLPCLLSHQPGMTMCYNRHGGGCRAYIDVSDALRWVADSGAEQDQTRNADRLPSWLSPRVTVRCVRIARFAIIFSCWSSGRFFTSV